MKIQDVTIDPELEAFLPASTDEEKAALRESVEQDGWTDPIIVWLNYGHIVDGHHRYRLWQELGSDPDNCPEIVEKKFADKLAVKKWMFRRQEGRRNWTPGQRAACALELKPAIAERAKERQVRKSNSVPMNSSEQKPVDTRKELAKIAGVSEDTIRKAEVVMEKGTPEVKAALKSGEISTNEAFKETKKSQFNPEEFDPEMKPGKKPKNGAVVKPKFDEKTIEKPMGSVRRAFEERKKAYPSSEREYRATTYAFNELCNKLKAWRDAK